MAKDAVEPVISDAEDEQAQDAERLNQQCFLMDNWRTFCRQPFLAKGYSSFTCIDGDPSDLVQRLTSKKGQSGFLNMTPAELALLQPKIKLFQIGLQPDKKPKSGPGTPVIFKTHYDEATISDMTSGARIRGDAAGLQSLSYEFYDAGSATMAARRQKITINFYAESLEALARGAGPGGHGTSPLDLAIQSPQYLPKTDGAGKPIPGKLVPNSALSAAKVVYGWSIPKEADELISKSAKTALKASIQTLVLSLTEHKLSFNENGSVGLEVEYQGYIDTRLSEVDKNILWPSDGSKGKLAENRLKAKEAKEASSTAKEALEKSEAADKKAHKDDIISSVYMDSAETDDRQDELEDAQKVMKEAEAELARTLMTDKAVRYRRVLDDLAASGKIYAVEVPKEQIGLSQIGGKFFDREVQTNMKAFRTAAVDADEYNSWDKEKQETYDKNRKKEAEARAKEPPLKITPGSASSLEAGAGAVDAHTKAGLEGTETGTMRDTLAKTGVVDSTQEQGAQDQAAAIAKFSQANVTAASDDGKVTINYMYFGDILTTVLKAAYNKQKLPIKYLVGPLSFRDPRTGTHHLINIADIPISLNLFTQFWINKVVKSSLEVYTIRQFITHAVRELIVAALGDGCYGGASKANTNPAGVTITTLSAPAGQDGKDRLGKKARLNPLSVDVVPTPKDDILPDASGADPKNHKEYLFIFCSSWTHKDLTEDVQKDADRGIYHIAVGQDAGPVKKVSFEKSDIKYHSTHQVMSTGTSIDRLAAAYKANVTMVGNTLFMPGNYVYIAPTSMGVSKAQARRMGLGGYYTITKLSGKVDSSGWTCDIECLPLGPTAGAGRPTNKPAPRLPDFPGNRPEAKP